MAMALGVSLCVAGCPNSEEEPPADAMVADAEAGMMVADAQADASPEECLPSDDMCPAGEYCQYTSGRLQCVMEGEFSSPLQGDPLTECPDGVCARGFMCMVDARGSERPTCYQVCSLALDAEPVFSSSDCTVGRHTCAPAIGDDGERLPFGLCYYGSP